MAIFYRNRDDSYEDSIFTIVFIVQRNYDYFQIRVTLQWRYIALTKRWYFYRGFLFPFIICCLFLSPL